MNKLIDQTQALDFITAGNAIFTVKSLKTGSHITYRTRVSDSGDTIFINVLTGSDNTSSYSPMAYLKMTNGFPIIKRVSKTWIKDDDIRMKAIKYIIYNLVNGIHINDLEIYHTGRCCRCGRLLTVPESIESGIGPECASKISKFKIEL